MNPTHLLTILRRAKRNDLSITSLHVLTVLGEKGSTPMHAIIGRFNISSAALTGYIDRMEKKQLVTRTHGQADRRTIFIDLTAKGHEALNNILRPGEPSFQAAPQPASF